MPAISDESIIVRKNGTIYLGGPPLVKAATGEIVSSEDLGGADVHCKISGVTDHHAFNKLHALELVRNIVKNLNNKSHLSENLKDKVSMEIEEPVFYQDELNGIITGILKSLMILEKLLLELLTESSKIYVYICYC